MEPRTLRLISWNVAARRHLLPAQAGALFDHAPDLVALQEVTKTTVGPWREALAAAGLTRVVDSFMLAPDHALLTGPRRYGELLASCWPVSALPPLAVELPWPERVLSCVLESPWGPVEAHTTYVPPGVTNGWVKIGTLTGLYRRLAGGIDGHRLLCGDLNAPQAELPDGTVVTWAQRIGVEGRIVCRGRWRGGRGEDWDAGERCITEGLAALGMPDVYRWLNGHAAPEPSWYWQAKGRRIGWRFDHTYASHSLNPVTCRYLHEMREQGLSDHSPMEVCFAPAGRAMRSPLDTDSAVDAGVLARTR